MIIEICPPWRVFGATLNVASVVVFALSNLSGCSGGEQTNVDIPPPGNMRVIGVEPVSQGPSELENLIPNGGFDEWWAGAPAPSEFVLPPASFSTVERKLDGPGDVLCLQTWKKSDRKAGGNNRMNARVLSIKANTEYEFSVRGASVEGGTATFDIYWTAADGTGHELLLFGAPVIPPNVESLAWYSARFTTKQTGNLMIYSGTVDDTVPPGAVVWDSWHLRELGPAAPEPQAAEGSVNFEPTAGRMAFAKAPACW